MPIYGLESVGLQDDEPPLATIEAMAKRYVSAVREVQAEGPYRLAGSSMGGTIAFEMARCLRSDGDEVDFLGLLDTPAPGHSVEKEDGRLELAVVRLLAGPKAAAEVEGRLASTEGDERLQIVLDAAQAAGSLPASYRLSDLRRLMGVIHGNSRAVLDYQPSGVFDGRMTYVRAADDPRSLAEHRQDPWSKLTDSIDVHDVPGEHLSIHHPPLVAELARVLAESLVDSVTESLAESPAE